ncbi:MAG: hypothetical protein ACRDZ4_06985 [Egibacteraceae bacterium]
MPEVGDRTADATQAVAAFREQKVSCPSCGNMLLKITDVKDAEQVSFTEEIKCKRGGCHKICRLVFASGKISVAIL